LHSLVTVPHVVLQEAASFVFCLRVWVACACCCAFRALHQSICRRWVAQLTRVQVAPFMHFLRLMHRPLLSDVRLLLRGISREVKPLPPVKIIRGLVVTVNILKFYCFLLRVKLGCWGLRVYCLGRSHSRRLIQIQFWRSWGWLGRQKHVWKQWNLRVGVVLAFSCCSSWVGNVAIARLMRLILTRSSLLILRWVNSLSYFTTVVIGLLWLLIDDRCLLNMSSFA